MYMFMYMFMNKHISLKTKFILIFCLMLVVIMSSGTFYLISQQNNIINSIVLQKGESISKHVAEMGVSPILSHNTMELDYIVKTALKDKEIVYIFFKDVNGSIVNTLNSSLNISPDEYDIWGIQPEDKESTLNNLMKNNDILTIQIPIADTKNIGEIYLGLTRTKFNAITNRSFKIMIIITIVVILFTTWISYFMFNKLFFRPLNNIINTVKNIAAGNLNTKIVVENDDEIGHVATTINHLTASFKTMVLSIRDLFSQLEHTGKDVNMKSENISKHINEQFSKIGNILSRIEKNTATLKRLTQQTDELKSSSEETAASLLELVASSSEITDNMNILNEEIENASSSLQQISVLLNDLVNAVDIVSKAVKDTSISMEEIRASIREIENISKESSKLALDIKQQTEQIGLTSIHSTIDGMKKIKESVDLTSDVISILDLKSKEIHKILNITNEVTDRTAMLSINTAILAAQAGEHGKAFAVVAEEIKNLAEDTSSSTEDIYGIIDMIQKEIKTAVQSMENGILKVAEGFSLAEEAGRIFHEIATSTQKSSKFSNKIYVATQEQSQGVLMVANAVEKINERMKQLSIVVKKQKEKVDNILLSFERMRDIAHQVRESTDEQHRASSQISNSADNISNMSAAIVIALQIVGKSNYEIFNSLQSIKQNSQNNMNASSEMSQLINSLLNKTTMLKETNWVINK